MLKKPKKQNPLSHHLNHLFADTIRQNWHLEAFTDYNGNTLTYRESGEKILYLHQLFAAAKIAKGDKIALLGSNSSMWGITFLGILTYGAIAVPILPDFSTDNIHHIINHSDAKLLFVSESSYEKIDIEHFEHLTGILKLSDYSVMSDPSKRLKDMVEKVSHQFDAKHITQDGIHFGDFNADDICVISYTSGTSGFTKGVMLPRRSIYSNIKFAQENMPLKAGEKIVSFLPLAHAYGLLFEFLFPVTLGCHITFLTRIPSPQIVTKAFQEVKPHLILSVPLVIEKIYKKRILPAIDKPMMKILLHAPVLSGLIQKKVEKKLTESFGGRFYELVIGGAPLSEDVEEFFRKIGFRFTIGYGMTECGPLITYSGWKESKHRSAGRVVDRMQIRIKKENSGDETGEILVKGDNIMSGYYKNEVATKEAFTRDGWLKTGDLGYLDKDGYLFIKGRSKNMILGPSGQNIYPEELEAKISNLPLVQECVVKVQNNRLIAMIYPDREAMESGNMSFGDIELKLKNTIRQFNKELPKYEQIADVEIVDVEFIKTPKRNIKRYLYT
ncbi:MAG: AMP-binding protein [Bacteroidales bacterium]|nr:AMP-binding protein [Bacteroidales bacterium]